MIHFTCTGIYAGVTYCGIGREEALSKGDKLVHGRFLNDTSAVCPDCLKIWNDSDECDVDEE